MTETSTNSTTTADRDIFRVRVSIPVDASPAATYALVSDLTRSCEWSPECSGGAWVSGTPGAVGSVFGAQNHREPDVVEWAPVLRGRFDSVLEVIEATPDTAFRWAICDSAGHAQESVWGFEIDRTTDGCQLTHTLWMSRLTEGMQKIVAGMNVEVYERFLVEWDVKIESEMTRSVARVAELLANGAGQ